MAEAGTLTYNEGPEVQPQWAPTEKPLVKKSEDKSPLKLTIGSGFELF